MNSASSTQEGPSFSAHGRAPPGAPPYRSGDGKAPAERKRPRAGTLVSPFSRQLYALMVRQLYADGFLAAASSVADATGCAVSLVEEGGDRLSKLVCYGLAGERQEERDVRQFAAENVVERHISAAKMYVPLQFSQSWAVGRRCFKMRERFTSSSLTSVMRDVAFSPDGSLVAAAGADGLAIMLALQTVEDLSALDEVRALNQARGATRPTGNGGEKGRSATTRNATEITELARARQFHEHGQSSVEVVRFHPTQPLLLTGGRDGNLILRDYALPEGRVAFKIHDTFPVRGASFHGSGDYVLFATDHPSPRLVNVTTGTVLSTPGTFAAHGTVHDNQRSFSRFDNRTSSVDSLSNHSPGSSQTSAVPTLSTQGAHGSASHTAGLTSVSFSPDGRTLASASLDGAWMLYDGVGGRVICKIDNAHSAVPVTSVAYSRSGQVLLTAGMDATARLWDLRRLSDRSAVTAGTPSSRFASAASDCELMSFGEPGKCEHRGIRACFSHDESQVICQDTTMLAVHSHSVYSGDISYTLTTQPTFIQRAVATSPFANVVVTGADDCRLRLWTPSWLP